MPYVSRETYGICLLHAHFLQKSTALVSFLANQSKQKSPLQKEKLFRFERQRKA
jgi:hypothetical protein